MSDLPVLKYIVTDDYKPLYALQKIHGPARGPIRTPVRVNIPTIEELLKQDDAAKLFEVIPIDLDEHGNLIFSSRVELTLENFKFSWFTLNGEEVPVINGKRLKNVDVYTPPTKEDSIIDQKGPESLTDDVTGKSVDSDSEFESGIGTTSSVNNGEITEIPTGEDSVVSEDVDTQTDLANSDPVADVVPDAEASTETPATKPSYKSARRR